MEKYISMYATYELTSINHVARIVVHTDENDAGQWHHSLNKK